ncbi:hypothetical protein F0L68_25620 [Solihabitans fulvus]|uniref:Uncharacterized protein n=1 Tax=Solihabitans fulvus TaxID=1892852 RepID=A0A5B2X1N9_9PSEU|nr:hypothetical protein [Solihabitans fulvus]KAA2257120.1 hypothetical protein F0L68_25620 [Solihabitans fulvus]
MAWQNLRRRPTEEGPAGADPWARLCLHHADRRATLFLGFALAVLVVCGIAVGWLAGAIHGWAYVLAAFAVPFCVELAAPGLRHWLSRRTLRRLLVEQHWHSVAVRFVPGRSRIGRQAFLEITGSDRTLLRLPDVPERIRDRIRQAGEVWLAGPGQRGLTAVAIDQRPFLTLARVVDR